MDIEQVPPKVDEIAEGAVLSNLKSLSIGDGKVRIKDGAIYITDETGLDRILIGYLKDAF